MYGEDGTTIIRKWLDRSGRSDKKPRNFYACGCLGLILMWYRTKGSCARGLALDFGMTSSQLYKWLKFGRRVLLHVLSRHPAAKVKLPSFEEKESFKTAVSSKYPYCPNVWGAGDGLNLLIDPPNNYRKQIRYYNKWKALRIVNCVFVFFRR